eukprot:2687332-Pleurochrysis_carterae.AAC.2
MKEETHRTIRREVKDSMTEQPEGMQRSGTVRSELRRRGKEKSEGRRGWDIARGSARRATTTASEIESNGQQTRRRAIHTCTAKASDLRRRAVGSPAEKTGACSQTARSERIKWKSCHACFGEAAHAAATASSSAGCRPKTAAAASTGSCGRCLRKRSKGCAPRPRPPSPSDASDTMRCDSSCDRRTRTRSEAAQMCAHSA